MMDSNARNSRDLLVNLQIVLHHIRGRSHHARSFCLVWHGTILARCLKRSLIDFRASDLLIAFPGGMGREAA